MAEGPRWRWESRRCVVMSKRKIIRESGAFVSECVRVCVCVHVWKLTHGKRTCPPSKWMKACSFKDKLYEAVRYILLAGTLAPQGFRSKYIYIYNISMLRDSGHFSFSRCGEHNVCSSYIFLLLPFFFCFLPILFSSLIGTMFEKRTISWEKDYWNQWPDLFLFRTLVLLIFRDYVSRPLFPPGLGEVGDACLLQEMFCFFFCFYAVR